MFFSNFFFFFFSPKKCSYISDQLHILDYQFINEYAIGFSLTRLEITIFGNETGHLNSKYLDSSF